MSEILEGANDQEVAEPDTLEGANDQEVAEPASTEETDSGETVDSEEETEEEPDGNQPSSQWAQIRREKEAAEQEAAELKAKLEEAELRRQLMSNAFESDNPEVEAIAEKYGLDPADLEADLEKELEAKKLKEENEGLKAELNNTMAIQFEQNAVRELQRLDPSIKKLSPELNKFIEGGLSATDAYYALKAKEAATKVQPAEEVGKVNAAKGDKTFFTKEEVEAMSEEELERNYEHVMNSREKW